MDLWHLYHLFQYTVVCIIGIIEKPPPPRTKAFFLRLFWISYTMRESSSYFYNTLNFSNGLYWFMMKADSDKVSPPSEPTAERIAD